MGKSKSIPSYRKHKATGLAVVTLSGKDIYLGPFGTRASRSKYDIEIAGWLARGRTLISEGGTTISELVSAYSCHAGDYYVKHGKPTSQAELVRVVAEKVAEHHGDELVAAFTASKLLGLRHLWIASGLARSTINNYAGIIKGLFRWGVANDLVPSSVLAGLNAVVGLEAGRSKAREPEPVGPVPDELVDKTLPFLPEVYRDKVKVQQLTGMRPNEVCGMTPGEVDRSGDIWIYRPSWHKTEHHGKGRAILIGPKAQLFMSGRMDGEPDSLVFPTMKRYEGRPRSSPPRLAATYRDVVLNACRRIPHEALDDATATTPEQAAELEAFRESNRWTPNQLRHSAATRMRREAGIEAARIALGHSTVIMTEIYAEKDLDSIKDLMRRIG